MEGFIPADNQLLQDALDVLPLLYDLFDEDVYAAVDLHACAEKRTSYGGTSVASVEEQIRYVKEQLAKSEEEPA